MDIMYRIQTIAENEQKVFEAGKKSQYDEFWDSLQNYGNRKDYYYAFMGRWVNNCWTQVTFNPKYPIICDGAIANRFLLFANSRLYTVTIPIIIKNGVMDNTFTENGDLHTIADLTLENVTGFTTPFKRMPSLEELGIKGEISANGFDVSSCEKLNKASITRVVNILSNNTSGLTVTLSLTAVNKAFETSAGANNGSTSTEWTTLVGTKSNWTISLV